MRLIQSILATIPLIFLIGFVLSRYLVFLILAFYTFCIIINLYRAKLQVADGVLIIPIASLLIPKTSFNKISVNSINKLHVQRMTPLTTTPEKITDVCWRDKIIIDDKTQLLGQFYGNLNQIIQEIIKLNPSISITYGKNTLKDNWVETDKSSLLQLTKFVVK